MDIQLKKALNSIGEVLIVGPKWCRKQQSNSIIQLQHPNFSKSYLKLADVDPSSLLNGKKPRLIDGWQMAPQLWDDVRFSVDESGRGIYFNWFNHC